MNQNQLKQLEKLAKVFNTDNVITPEDIAQVVEGIAQIIKVERENVKGISEEYKQTLQSVIETVSNEHDKILKEVKNTSQNAVSEATKALDNVTKGIEEVKRIAKEVLEMKPENGKDADEDLIVEKVLAEIKLPEYKETVLDNGEQIRDKLTSLEGDKRLDISAIKGTDKLTTQANLDRAISILDQRTQFLVNKVNNAAGATAFTSLTDVPSSYTGQAGKAVRVNVGETGLEFFTASGTGTVTSVAATVPTGLTISGSPITAAGTLAIGLDTGRVIPLQSTLDGLVPYTGATANVDLGIYDLITDTITSKSSSGLIIENNGGGDVLHIGSGGGVNATAYGGWNFDGATANTIAIFGASKTLSSADTATYPSLTELTYVKGVTSAIQTQLNAKVDDGAVTTSGLTMATSRVLGRTTASTGAIEELSTVDSFVSAASDTTAGKIEVATTAETNIGTDATRAVSPDGLAGSYAGTKSVSIAVFAPTTDVATGDGKAYITIPEALNGMDLIRAQATVVTAGTTNATTVMIHNVTDAVDMLSGAISIASGGTVGTVGTINTSNDGVATNDILRVDVDSISTTAPKGLMVILEFRLP